MNNLTLEQEQEQVRIDLAAMFRLSVRFGWDDTVWNHITARVPGSDHHFYMHRFGLHYSEVSASNLIKVDENGKVIEGPQDVNTAGFIIHSAVHLNHAESKFVFHAHPPSAIAATAFEEIPFLVQDSSMLYGKIGYHDWEGISDDKDERNRIAERLEGNSCLVMRNHGLLTVGKTAGECFMHMFYLIRMCEVAIQVGASGLKTCNQPPEVWRKASEQYAAYPPGKYEWPALKRLLDRDDPTYKD